MYHAARPKHTIHCADGGQKSACQTSIKAGRPAMSQARELRVTQHLQIAGTNSSGSSRLASDWRNLLLLVKLPRILSCAPVRLLWDDAARLCWLVLRGGAAAESEAACDSLLALDLSLPPVEIQPLSMAASSSLSPCKKCRRLFTPTHSLLCQGIGSLSL